jgi:hypothetical protein
VIKVKALILCKYNVRLEVVNHRLLDHRPSDILPIKHMCYGSLHFTVPSMNRLNQTEPATFSILPCWAFFGDSYFSILQLYK